MRESMCWCSSDSLLSFSRGRAGRDTRPSADSLSSVLRAALQTQDRAHKTSTKQITCEESVQITWARDVSAEACMWPHQDLDAPLLTQQTAEVMRHAYYLKRKLFPCSLLSLVKSVLHLQMCVVFVMTIITSYTEPLPLLFQLSWMQNHVFLQYPTQLHQKRHECQRSLRTHRHTWGFNFIKRNEQKP